MSGRAVTKKPKPKKEKVGSGGDTHLSNNINFSITQYPPWANQNSPSETPQLDSQTIKKTRQMEPKYQKLPLCSEPTGFQSRDHGSG